MEAAQAGQAVEGQEQTQGENQGQEGAEQEQAAPDYTPIFERMEQMGQDFSAELEERLASLQPAQQQEALAPSAADEMAQMLESGEEPDPQQARAILGRMVDEALEARVSPYAREVEELRMERAADQLFEELPALKDEKALEAAYDAAFDVAIQMTRGNEEQAMWLANQPQMIRFAHLAGVAGQQRAADEASGAEQDVELESAGAARPGQADDDEALKRAIREAGPTPNRYLTG